MIRLAPPLPRATRLIPGVLLLALAVHAQEVLVPAQVSLHPAAMDMVTASYFTPEERAELRIRHGIWTADDATGPVNTAQIALATGNYDAGVFTGTDVPRLLRATAASRRGDLEEVLRLLPDASGSEELLLRADAFNGLGERTRARLDYAEAEGSMPDDRNSLDARGASLLARARLADMEGQPARGWKEIMSSLVGIHQEFDRLHWPSRLIEAELLWKKHNLQEAVLTWQEVLSLNPRSAEAWAGLGRVALDGFNFDATARALSAIRAIDPGHPQAILLEVEMRLLQDDPDEARLLLAPLLSRYPGMRDAHGFLVAATALDFDPARTSDAIAIYEEFSPGRGTIHCTTGRALVRVRQYETAADFLREASRREPNWILPRVELALLHMQTGDIDSALHALRDAATRDPFDKRIANSLLLLEEITLYDEVKTEHFVLRYPASTDAVLAATMEPLLDDIHRQVTRSWGAHAGHPRTIIELMPDHPRFAVRITGMPDIYTMAVCHGPLIVMEVPRRGIPSEHFGPYDWARVLRHEYTHTITLARTNYHIPHWLTEAAAVDMERAPRSFDTCLMLAGATTTGTLFKLDEIRWAFIRPEKPHHRALAYAQSHWMLQFMQNTCGNDAVQELLDTYARGTREVHALPMALGLDTAAFEATFLAWAEQEVRDWGLSPEPSIDTLRAALREQEQTGAPPVEGGQEDRPAPGPRPVPAISDSTLRAWMLRYPDHPDVLALDLKRRLQARGEPDPTIDADLQRLLTLRPVDPWPHRILARRLIDRGEELLALPHLEALDLLSQDSADLAQHIARLHRRAGHREHALVAIRRAVNLDVYNPAIREDAAAIAIESGLHEEALLHLEALLILEPEQELHRRRLERFREMIG